MPTPYTPAKIITGIKAIGSLGLMAIGFLVARGPMTPIGVVLAAFGCFQAARNFALLIRILAAEQMLASGPRVRLDQEVRRASMPRKIFLLLWAVAEIDGAAGTSERDLVRRFLLERFPQASLRDWKAERVRDDQLDELVHELRAMLTFSECVTVFSWCCHVALIDRKFNASEHETLQRIARHFGLPPHAARQLFLQAKNRILGADQEQQRRAGPRAPFTPRKRALEVLGLDERATAEQIRKRHRELVKQYHPDAHSHLGPVAAEEATQRFREIQEAYEALSG